MIQQRDSRSRNLLSSEQRVCGKKDRNKMIDKMLTKYGKRMIRMATCKKSTFGTPETAKCSKAIFDKKKKHSDISEN